MFGLWRRRTRKLSAAISSMLRKDHSRKNGFFEAADVHVDRSARGASGAGACPEQPHPARRQFCISGRAQAKYKTWGTGCRFIQPGCWVGHAVPRKEAVAGCRLAIIDNRDRQFRCRSS